MLRASRESETTRFPDHTMDGYSVAKQSIRNGGRLCNPTSSSSPSSPSLDGPGGALYPRITSMAWFRKEKRPRQPVEQKRGKVPEGLWTKCDGCSQIIYKKEVARNA